MIKERVCRNTKFFGTPSKFVQECVTCKARKEANGTLGKGSAQHGALKEQKRNDGQRGLGAFALSDLSGRNALMVGHPGCRSLAFASPGLEFGGLTDRLLHATQGHFYLTLIPISYINQFTQALLSCFAKSTFQPKLYKSIKCHPDFLYRIIYLSHFKIICNFADYLEECVLCIFLFSL